MAQSLQYKTLLSDDARDDSAEVNLSFKLKKKIRDRYLHFKQLFLICKSRKLYQIFYI